MLEQGVLDEERSRFFVQTRGLLGLTLVGVLYWPLIGALGFFLPPRPWILAALGLILLSAPFALLAIRHLYRERYFDSPLAPALLASVAPVALALTCLLPAYHHAPSSLSLIYVVGMALLWPGIAWLFDQGLYLANALARTGLALSVWALAPGHLFTWLPIAVGGLYLLTSTGIAIELKRARSTA